MYELHFVAFFFFVYFYLVILHDRRRRNSYFILKGKLYFFSRASLRITGNVAVATFIVQKVCFTTVAVMILEIWLLSEIVIHYERSVVMLVRKIRSSVRKKGCSSTSVCKKGL